MGNVPISNMPINLSIEPISRLVLVRQGNNSIKLTVEQINGLKRLKMCEIETYQSKVKPKNSFKLLKNFNILAKCIETNSIILFDTNERKDIDILANFLENNRGKIARDIDLKEK